nr:SPFH domain-containing protein [Streptomyces sp. sk226]
MTPNDDQSPRTSSTPAPHPLDDRLPPSLFAPPGRGSPPPLFGGDPVLREGGPVRSGGDPVLREGGPVGSGGDPVSRSGGPVRSGGDFSSQPGADLAPPTSGARGPRGGLLPPPLFRPVEPAPAPERHEGPIAPSGAGSASAFPQAGGTACPSPQAGETASPSGQAGGSASPFPQAGGAASPSGQADRNASAPPAAGREAPAASPSGGAASSVPPRGAGPQSPGVSPHLGAVPDPDVPGPGRSADRPAPKPAAEGPSADRTAPARPAPLDGNLYFKPVRRARTEPSGEWTPHPSYGAEPGGAKPDAGTIRGGGPGAGSADAGTAKGAQPGAGKPEAGPANGSGASAHDGPEAGRAPRPAPARGPVDDAGPDTELDLVLDLAAGDRAASATFSVPSPSAEPAASPTTGAAATVTAAATTATAATGSPANASATAAVSSVTASTTATATTTTPYPARRHSVIGNETTASIPVHLLFRDDREPAEATALPAGVLRRPVEDRAPATRRPPVPRSPQTRVRPSTRPAPDADPRLTERPGPALPGSAALLAGAAAIVGGLAVLWWRGVLPATWQTAAGLTPRPDLGIGAGAWALLAALTTVTLLALGGLGRGRVGYAWVLTLFGDYRGSVRRTGLVWVSPLLLRRRVDVRLRHWRSEPLPAVDATGTALRVVVLVVWRIKDTVRAALGIEDHEAYLSAQVEAALARVLSQLPADAFHEDAPSLRDAEAVGDALTRLLKADCEPVGVEVYSAQPTGIEYAPEVAAAMQRRRIAAIDSKHRDSVLTSVVDAVDDTVNRLTTRGIVELDDYERKALVKDLTVAFYTGRSGAGDGA